jgi:hypothetical protein
VIIGPSFADIFFNNCFKNGLLPIKLDAAEVEELFAQCLGASGYRLAWISKAQTITRADGKVIPFNVDAVPPRMPAQWLGRHRPDPASRRHHPRLRSPSSHRAALAVCLITCDRPSSVAVSQRKKENYMKICVLPGDGIGPEIIESDPARARRHA